MPTMNADEIDAKNMQRAITIKLGLIRARSRDKQDTAALTFAIHMLKNANEDEIRRAFRRLEEVANA